jgi:vacuolar-type H+-ATPase subunit C/Vma6
MKWSFENIRNLVRGIAAANDILTVVNLWKNKC